MAQPFCKSEYKLHQVAQHWLLQRFSITSQVAQ